MEVSEQDRPLLTFALFAYNQERFIGKAIEGAFSQSYLRLEIILSDDCSADRTFDIMKQMAATYNGPHKVILNRNDKNLGIGEHINRIMQIAEGELIVGAAGDDISLPARTEKIYKAWRTDNCEAYSIYSSVNMIDENGKVIGLLSNTEAPVNYSLIDRVKRMSPDVIGCSHAWHKDVFLTFGPLLQDIVYEDRVISFRSALLGKIISIDEPLVLYRQHDSNVCFSALKDNLLISNALLSEEQVIMRKKRQLTVYQQYLKDIETSYHNKLIEINLYSLLKNEAVININILNDYCFFSVYDTGKKLSAIVRSIKEHKGFHHTVKLIIKLISPKIYFLIKDIRIKCIKWRASAVK